MSEDTKSIFLSSTKKLSFKDYRHHVKGEGWNKAFQARVTVSKQVSILLADNTDFKQLIKRDKGHFFLIKGTVHHEDIIILIYMY